MFLLKYASYGSIVDHRKLMHAQKLFQTLQIILIGVKYQCAMYYYACSVFQTFRQSGFSRFI